MPSKSPAQKRTMAALAHGWTPPASRPDLRSIPPMVAREFHESDKRAKKRGKIKLRKKYHA